MRKTQRGFSIYSEFKDVSGNTVTVQESSLATAHACWVFVKRPDGTDTFKSDGKHYAIAPQLTKAQAKRLAKALMKFVESP